MEKNRFKKIDVFILSFILVLGLTLRLYKINAPLSDAYSWRQADTAAVSRNFVRNGFNVLSPRYDDLSSIQSGLDNPQGYRFVEFPIYNAIFALMYKIAPIIPIEVYGRLTTVFFSLVILSIIYYLLLKEHTRPSAILGSLTYGILPAFVFFSRIVLPETTAVAFSFLAILFLYWWQFQKKRNLSIVLYLLSSLCFAISIQIKPTAIFYGLVFAYIFIVKYKFDVFKKWDVYAFLVLTITPLLLWRSYIQTYPEGIPSSDWLIGMVNTYEGQKNILLKPAFFRWIFFERINVMIMGGFMTPFFIAGLFTRFKKAFLHVILLCVFLYLFVFEGGNVQHEYYQTIILAPLAMFVGVGVALFLEDKKRFIHPLFIYPVIVVCFVLSFSFSYYYKVKDFYTYPSDLDQMAKIIDTFTLPGDKIITDRMGDTTLLYLADRKGAPMLYGTIPQMQEKGYSYYMTDKKEIISDLKIKNQYKILFENAQFAFFKL